MLKTNKNKHKKKTITNNLKFNIFQILLILRKSLRKAENKNVEEKELVSILNTQRKYFKSLIKRVTRRAKVWAAKIETKERNLR
jgi:hypothetical protein